ncbi:DUF2982 domain-containing protein [Thalassotalea euphylliae]|uniref:DUF2982 domain-containing protein n=1 Tax=Thalassotalea euphylliae TaxID=1655234 RepID=UPI00364432B7
MQAIKIKPVANHNGQFLILTGVALLVTTIALSHHFWETIRLPLIFLLLASCVIIFIGAMKKMEPRFSYLMTPEFLEYTHKYGTWRIDWQNIQRVGDIRLAIGIDQKTLPYIGIKLKDHDAMVTAMSKRLASRLPHEQRPLTTAAVQQSLLSFEQAQINFEPYITSGNTTIKGPNAFYMHHASALAMAYGYHLFLPYSSLDRSAEEFISLLRECQTHSASYLK